VGASSCLTFSKAASSPMEGRKLRWVQGVEVPQFGQLLINRFIKRNCVRSRFQWLYSHKTESVSAWQPGPRDLLPLGGRHFTVARLLTLAIWTLADTLPRVACQFLQSRAKGKRAIAILVPGRRLIGS
jgi:hypothetical protein